MIFLQETTDWGDINCPNHIYCLDDKKEYLLGYIMAGTNEHKMFSKPIRFDMRYRKFKELSRVKVEKPVGRAVQGSKGETYYVNDEEGTCTCSGFKYRGACKHVAELQHA